jgi:hypothetical protein
LDDPISRRPRAVAPNGYCQARCATAKQNEIVACANAEERNVLQRTQVAEKQIAAPTVVKVDETFYMYYEGVSEFKPRPNETPSEYNNSVFLAISSDAKHWTKWPNNEDPQPAAVFPCRPSTLSLRLGVRMPLFPYARMVSLAWPLCLYHNDLALSVCMKTRSAARAAVRSCGSPWQRTTTCPYVQS